MVYVITPIEGDKRVEVTWASGGNTITELMSLQKDVAKAKKFVDSILTNADSYGIIEL